MSLETSIKEQALQAGFDLVGIAPLPPQRDLDFCREWLEKGYGGEMHYLANPKRDDPRQILDTVKSIICVGLIYNAPYPYSIEVAGRAGSARDAQLPRSASPAPSPTAWISRYGWGKDYHRITRSKLEKLRTAVKKLVPGVETRVFVDTGPMAERAFARLSGIGWTGKNTCLINQQKGSWFFVGVILTDLELGADLPAPDRCGSCTRCLEACPTGALVEPYVMDASRCIAYFNIELKEAIPEKYRTAIGANVFGCDICQDVCPWNSRPASSGSDPPPGDGAGVEALENELLPRRVATTTLAEFQPMQIETSGTESANAQSNSCEGPAHSYSLFNPSLEALAAMTQDDFRKLFAHSPIKRVKFRRWLRNLCVAIGNSRDRRFVGWLKDVAQHSDAMVCEHAEWALRQLTTDSSEKGHVH